jgi:hypothetical protein
MHNFQINSLIQFLGVFGVKSAHFFGLRISIVSQCTVQETEKKVLRKT